MIYGCGVVPVQEQEVAAQVDGVLRELDVDLGTPVTPRQLLGRLDDGQLRPQMELLQIKAASRAAELIAKAQHDEARAPRAVRGQGEQVGVALGIGAGISDLLLPARATPTR